MGRARVRVGLGLGLGLASRNPNPNLHQGCSDTAALLVASMVLLDGACLVESRLLLTDSVLFFFELLQLYAMARTRAAPLNSASWVRWL